MKTKDMKQLHNLPQFGEVVKSKGAKLRNFGHGSHEVQMEWAWNDAVAREQVFKLKHDCPDCGKAHELIIDWQEMMHYGRAIKSWQSAKQEIKQQY